MVNSPDFASAGTKTSYIDVQLSYKIVKLFSEGLYASPNKAVEELVANSFDAGASRVHILLSPNLHAQDATIAVIDDGVGMDQDGLKQHWLIGISNKRELSELPEGRKQIGKFGIGKLSTYVLANRLTHISKTGSKYYLTSMDYHIIDRRVDNGVEPKKPIKIDLFELTAKQAKQAIRPWAESAEFKAAKMPFFGDGSPKSWTVSIMSDLKPKVHEIRPGRLRWILRTALPLRPDFAIWLKNENLKPSKADKSLLEEWIIGKDIDDLPNPAPKNITTSEDKSLPEGDTHRFGLDVPDLGRVTGYAEAYEDLLTGDKSDDIGRSHGFFVYAYGRLINVDDGHFGISPNELKHGIFNRFRLVVYMDGLDEGLRSNRETVAEGPLYSTAQNVLRTIFNVVRHTIEKHLRNEDPGERLSRNLAASPASLARNPIVELARDVIEGRKVARYLTVPDDLSGKRRQEFLADLDKRAHEGEQFATDVVVDFKGDQHDGIVKFATSSGVLRLNGLHPFVATFYDEFTGKSQSHPLELLAMAEVLAEAYLHSLSVPPEHIDGFLSMRDQFLRRLVDPIDRQNPLSVANALQDARNDSDRMEECLCNAFRSLGFDVTRLGKKRMPDGVAAADLPPDQNSNPRSYRIVLEAKSKQEDGKKVSARNTGLESTVRHLDDHNCDHAVVVGPGFSTKDGDGSALGQFIRRYREMSNESNGPSRTITLMNVDDLARLVRLRPVKQVGLGKIRELFMECSLPEQSSEWVDAISQTRVTRPPYRKILETIKDQQGKFKSEPVTYSALRIGLLNLTPDIRYDRDEEIREICKAMENMAPGAIWAHDDRVELEQSVDNVMAAIEAATRDYPVYEQ